MTLFLSLGFHEIKATSSTVSFSLLQPIAEISQRIKALNRKRAASGLPVVLVHTDAAQAWGQRRVDVEALGVDFLTIVGHKVRPRRPPPPRDLEAHLRAGPTAPLIIRLSSRAPGGHGAAACGPRPRGLKKGGQQQLECRLMRGTGGRVGQEGPARQGCGRVLRAQVRHKAGGFSQVVSVLCRGQRVPADPSPAHSCPPPPPPRGRKRWGSRRCLL